jgi:ATP-binding cassette, subfamily B, bacterial
VTTIDPNLIARAGTIAPPSQDSAVRIIGRGLETAPILREGLGVTWLLAAVGAAGRVVVPILIQQAIDKGIDEDTGDVRFDLIVRMALIGVVAVLISGLALRQASIRLGERSERALYDLRTRLIGHIHQLSLATHNDERRGGLVSRVTSDIESLAQFFQWGGLAWLLDGTLMIIVAAVMLAYNWQLALIAFAVSMPLAFVLRAVQSRLVRAYDGARHANGDMLGTIAEVVSGTATIRAYGAGEVLEARVNDVVEVKTAAQIKASLIGAFLFPSGEIFSAFTISAIVGVGVWLGPSESLTAGAVVGFIFLTYRFLEPIAEFTEVLDQTQNAVAGLRRVLSVLDLPIGPPPPDDPIALPDGTLRIDIRDVTFSYPSRDRQGDDSAVLRHIDVTIPAGQQVAIVGSTGSGKTTLGRLIARFADPTIGAIELGGVPLRRVDRAELRRRLVVVAQEPFLFDDSISANVRFAAEHSTTNDVERVVDELGVRDWVDSLTDGLGTKVGERGDQLSAGEHQLVALLRAGLAGPDVLILDEATSSVDALTEVRVARALERLAASRTTIAIAHRLSTASRADRVLVLEHGRLVEDGHHDELIASNGPYRRLYDAWVSSTSV